MQLTLAVARTALLVARAGILHGLARHTAGYNLAAGRHSTLVAAAAVARIQAAGSRLDHSLAGDTGTVIAEDTAAVVGTDCTGCIDRMDPTS